MDNEQEYIDEVKSILDSTTDKCEAVWEITKLAPPNDSSPLALLIHGDSQELQDMIDTDVYMEEDAVESTDQQGMGGYSDLCIKIIEKIKGYLKDWDNGRNYKIRFKALAPYSVLVDKSGNLEYVELLKPLEASSISEAINEADDWDEKLRERVDFYKSYPPVPNYKGPLKGSLQLVYKVFTLSPYSIIANGRLWLINDKHYISTWQGREY